MSKTKKQNEEQKPEVLEEFQENVKAQTKTEEIENTLVVEEFPEEVNLKELVGKKLILINATIDERPNFNIIHLVFHDDKGNEILARTTSKAVEMQVRRLMQRGLGNGKAFELCVKQTQSKYGTPMLQFTSPKLCQ